jgi:hypothetical protein
MPKPENKKIKKIDKSSDSIHSDINSESKSRKKDTKKKEIKHKKDEVDSSEISDMDDNENLSDAAKYDADKKVQSQAEEDYDDMDEDEKKEYIQTVVLDRVLKYIKLDDVIKQKQNDHKKEMKVIKDSKEQLENFLIGYLDKVDEEYIQLKDKATLIKTVTETKAAPKMEDISVSLVEGFKKHEIYDDEADIKRVVKDFIETIESKREIKTRKYLKRTAGDPGKIVEKGKKNINNKESDKEPVKENKH